MTDNDDKNSFGKLPDHLLIEIFIRVPVSEWAQISCVKRHWANLFRGECLWQSAISRSFASAGQAKRWPGPIPRGLSRRRYAALYVCKHIFSIDGEINEIVGHTYLFLKEQLEHSTIPPPSGILHGTIIGLLHSDQNAMALSHEEKPFSKKTRGRLLPRLLLSMADVLEDDQFIACGESRDMAHELASQIWLAVLDNMEENEHTFLLLKHLAQEGDVFLPYPYSRSFKVQWRVYEKLFTDFRDCFNHVDYYDVLASAKNKFQPIPPTWLGY